WNDPPPPRARSLPVRPRSAPIGSGSVGPDGSHRSPPESAVSTNGSDQTTAQSAEGSHPSASAPTSAPSGSPCNGSEVFASSATLLLPTQYLVCCIHRLNPQSNCDSRRLN